MTRLFKVSLSVIALLLVALMVFTGCGNEALTKAEEAEKAVATATAELEAALANKADAKELTDKVAALTAAIQAAETVATDGDVALKASIEEAKNALTANVETLLKAHKVDVAGLLAGKASKEDVSNQVKDLKKMINDIETATLAAIDLKAYVDWTTVAAAYAYELDNIYVEIENYKELYTESQWTAIHKAYKVAEVSIYRSFGSADDTSMADDAFNAFKAVLAANPNAVDNIYYGENGIVEFLAAEDNTVADAKALFENVLAVYNASGAKAQELFRAYYVINSDNELVEADLLVDTLGYWKNEISADVLALSKIHPVYSTNATFNKDAENFAAVKASLAAFTAALDNNTFDDGVVVDFVASELTAFNRNDAFLTELNDATNGAVAFAEAVKALEFAGDITLTHNCVDTVNAWSAKCVEWETKFLKYKPANFNTEDGLTENEQRFLEVKALIDETRAKLDVAKAAVNEAAAIFKADAKEFMDIIAKYYVSADDMTLDTTKVVITDGAEILRAYNLSKAWAAKYSDVLNIAIEYSQAEKKPADALNEAITLNLYYINKYSYVVNDWNTLDIATLDKYVAGTEVAGIYDTKIYAAIAWFEFAEGDEYGFVVDGVFQEGCAIAGLEKANAEYYQALKALAAELDARIAAKAEAATNLNNALNNLANVTLATQNIIADAEALKDAYDVDYDPANDLNAVRGFTVEYGTKIEDAKAKLSEVMNAQNEMDHAVVALKEIVVGTAYPYFDAPGLADQATFQAAIDYLKQKIAAFELLNNGKETFTAEADQAVTDAEALVAADDEIDGSEFGNAAHATLIALEELKKANANFIAAKAKLNVTVPFFTVEMPYEAFGSVYYELKGKITAYETALAASGFDADPILAEAKANEAAGSLIMAKQNIYYDYAEFCETATAGKGEAIVNDINVLLTLEFANINNYTAEDVANEEKIAADFNTFKNIVNNKLADYT